MRRLMFPSSVALALAIAIPAFLGAQGMQGMPGMGGGGGGQDQDRVIPNGGITAAGWKGKVDAGSAKFNHTVNDSKFAMSGSTYTLNIGPAAVYWNPANTAKGDYTVSATFSEPQYQNVNAHPHPYGIFIGGSQMDSDKMSLLYCSAYGNGTFIVRGFTAPQPPAQAGGAPVVTFRMGGAQPTANPAVHQAEGVGKPITQDIALTVKGDQVMCSINGTVVATYPKSEIVMPSKLESTDGVYGIRVSHNVDVTVTNLKKN